jgi:hypothetical protein
MPPTKLSKIGKPPCAYSLSRRFGRGALRRRHAQLAAFGLHPRLERHTIFTLIGMTAVRRPPVLLTIAAMLAVSAGAAEAATCYVLFDRYDNVVYRNTVSPIDLSDQGAAARAALRQRGEYLLVMDSDRCAPVTFVFGAAGSKTLSLDETVGGFPAENSPTGRPSAKARRGSSATPAVASPDRSAPANAK